MISARITQATIVPTPVANPNNAGDLQQFPGSCQRIQASDHDCQRSTYDQSQRQQVRQRWHVRRPGWYLPRMLLDHRDRQVQAPAAAPGQPGDPQPATQVGDRACREVAVDGPGCQKQSQCDDDRREDTTALVVVTVTVSAVAFRSLSRTLRTLLVGRISVASLHATQCPTVWPRPARWRWQASPRNEACIAVSSKRPWPSIWLVSTV